MKQNDIERVKKILDLCKDAYIEINETVPKKRFQLQIKNAFISSVKIKKLFSKGFYCFYSKTGKFIID